MTAHRIDNDLYALTAAPWQGNFRHGERCVQMRSRHGSPFGRIGLTTAMPEVLFALGPASLRHSDVIRARGGACQLKVGSGHRRAVDAGRNVNAVTAHRAGAN